MKRRRHTHGSSLVVDDLNGSAARLQREGPRKCVYSYLMAVT